MKITLWRRHALTVADGAFSHDYVTIFEEIPNLKGHPNCITGSKVTAISLIGGFCPLAHYVTVSTNFVCLLVSFYRYDLYLAVMTIVLHSLT